MPPWMRPCVMSRAITPEGCQTGTEIRCQPCLKCQHRVVGRHVIRLGPDVRAHTRIHRLAVRRITPAFDRTLPVRSISARLRVTPPALSGGASTPRVPCRVSTWVTSSARPAAMAALRSSVVTAEKGRTWMVGFALAAKTGVRVFPAGIQDQGESDERDRQKRRCQNSGGNPPGRSMPWLGGVSVLAGRSRSRAALNTGT